MQNHLQNHSFQQNFENLFLQLVFCGFMKANQYTFDLIISFYYMWPKGYTTNPDKLLKQGISILSVAI